MFHRSFLGLLHDGHHHLLCHARHAFTSLSRCSSDSLHLPLRVHGTRQWILRRTALQNPEGQGVETSRLPDGNTVPRNHLLARSFHQLLHLGQTLERGNPVHNHVVDGCHVVRYLFASRLRRLLLRIQEAAVRATRAHKSDPATSSRTGDGPFIFVNQLKLKHYM